VDILISIGAAGVGVGVGFGVGVGVGFGVGVGVGAGAGAGASAAQAGNIRAISTNARQMLPIIIRNLCLFIFISLLRVLFTKAANI
jgi:hypothetical protein